ncbi:unnamed protein product [Danaus chrysippus]|uniref:Dol-P-Glc:Glc(2)Man(9)GlcNAc(2)-PP-Dol alpha-1,2-glucosyltransferase n=1 Tax=Danaus chrysippus TaxID=151541 RepID=A0A8J2MJE3_9NEOP|nr:unnamed protein product [Danaus chrysippus]
MLLMATMALYFMASKILFDKVNETSKMVIQGLSFCNRNFSYCDPKLTTLPGLYLVTAAFKDIYFPCITYILRFINLGASCLNLTLFSSILKFIYGNQNDNQCKVIFQALNLALLPPLYFFSHVYYTETLSLLLLLMFSTLCFINKSKYLIFIFGVLSVLMRQTNIAWIAMVFGFKVLNILIRSSRVFGNNYLRNTMLSKRSLIARDIDTSKLKRYYGLTDVYIALKYHLPTFFTNSFQFITTMDWFLIVQQLMIMILYVVFVFINGSFVVGDKDSHTPTLHLPQMLYFLLFYGVFGVPYVLRKLLSTLKLLYRNKLLFVLIACVFLVVVHYNTIVHPCIVADNRHYTFYIWNRWYGKYDYAKYATVPLYVFLLFSLYDNLKDQNCITFLLPYSMSLFLVLCLQPLVEIRYFLTPYIILRFRFAHPSFKTVLFEFVWYVTLNVLSFYIFFTKEIIWSDINNIQRIIW